MVFLGGLTNAVKDYILNEKKEEFLVIQYLLLNNIFLQAKLSQQGFDERIGRGDSFVHCNKTGFGFTWNFCNILILF